MAAQVDSCLRQRQSVAEVCRCYTQDTSVHCLKYVSGKHFSLSRKLFWVVVILVALSGFLGTMFYQFKAMLSYPTRLSLEVKIADQLPFPAVTICSTTCLRKSQAKNITGLYEFMLSRLAIKRNGHPSIWNGTVDAMLDHVSESEAAQLRNMAYTLDMTFMKCFWENKERQCSDLFVRRRMDGCICHTFNGLVNGLNQTLVSKTPGFNNGLHLVLNVNQSEHLPTRRWTSAALRVILHDSAETPLPNTGFIVGPGLTNEAKIKLRQITYLSTPYKVYGDSTCKNPSEGKLKYFPFYDTGACMWECIIDYVIEKCGCKRIYAPAVVPVPYCNASKVATCSDRYVDDFWGNATLRQTCPCFPTCSQRLYDASLSVARFPSDAFGHHLGFDEEGIEWFRKNYLELQLFYGDFMYDQITQEPIYTFESICATIGGQMGLYMGISLLSVVELGHLIIMCLWTFLDGYIADSLKGKISKDTKNIAVKKNTA